MEVANGPRIALAVLSKRWANNRSGCGEPEIERSQEGETEFSISTKAR